MTPLAAKLKARIEADGPMSVADWMTACLSDPEHGYYMTRDPFGRAGDFITAPEISQMFGELLGLWSAVVWQQMGSPSAFNLLELGPGRGTLMRDALRAAHGVPAFAEALNVHMVETSPVLTAAQKTTLAGVPGAPTWHRSPDTVPARPTIVLANEFLDALPIRQLHRAGGQWCERMVTVDADEFQFDIGGEVDATLVPAALRDAAEGAVYEVSPAVSEMVSELSARILRDGGVMLLIDYGHSAHGLGETLQALRGHAFADPLALPGEHDLTAHVDFALVEEVASEAGMRVWGPMVQGELLERLGIAARATMLLGSADKRQAEDIATARRRLVDTDAMGRLFKAIAIAHPDLPAPPGFEEVRWA